MNPYNSRIATKCRMMKKNKCTLGTDIKNHTEKENN